MTVAMTVAGTVIARDPDGRYSLNDLHRAAGGLPRHRPSRWVENQQTQALAAAASTEAGIPALVSQHGGAAPGTYVAEPLVIAYAAWISPQFHLQVLNTFLATQRHAPTPQPTPDPLQLLADPAALRQLLLGYTEKVQALQDQVHHQAPKLQALDALASAAGSFNITEAAKLLQVPPRQLFTWLEQNGWIYRRAGGRNWLAYQPRLQSGVLTHKAAVIRDRDDVEHVCEQVRVTAKGLARLGELLGREKLGWGTADHLRAQQYAAGEASR
jgi:phage antirepressor YoqD-like protein